MDPLAPVKSFDRFQQHHPVLAVPCATIKKFSDDRSGNLVALVAYYSFLSLFPLLLVFMTLLGYVLAGDAHLQQQVEDSVLSRFPVIGSSIDQGKLHGSALALVIGIVLSLWSGLGVTQSAQHAFNRIWEVPQKHRPNFFLKRLRGIVVLVAFGTLLLVTSIVSGLVGGGVSSDFATIAGLVISFVLNLILLVTAYRVLCSAKFPWLTLAPGAVLGALLWLALQTLGGAYIAHIRHSSGAYGTFALVIGVLAWLHIGALITLYCNTLNVVVARDRWPRSLLGPDNQIVARRDGVDEAKAAAKRDDLIV